MLLPCFDLGLDWNTLSGLGYSCTHINPQPCIGTRTYVSVEHIMALSLPSCTAWHTKEQFWICIVVVIRCLWFLLLSTSSLVLTIILSSSWRTEVHFTRYLKSTSLLWPSQKNVSKFYNPLYTLVNHLLWDQDFKPLWASDPSADFLTL